MDQAGDLLVGYSVGHQFLIRINEEYNDTLNNVSHSNQ